MRMVGGHIIILPAIGILFTITWLAFNIYKTSSYQYIAENNVLALSDSSNRSEDSFSQNKIEYLVISETPIPTPTKTPTPVPTRTPTPVPITFQELESLFEKYSSSYSIDKQTLRKIAYCESKFNSNALNGPYAGIYQFTSGAWTSARIRMNADPNPILRFNPEEAIKTAAFKIAVDGTSAWPYCRK